MRIAVHCGLGFEAARREGEAVLSLDPQNAVREFLQRDDDGAVAVVAAIVRIPAVGAGDRGCETERENSRSGGAGKSAHDVSSNRFNMLRYSRRPGK